MSDRLRHAVLSHISEDLSAADRQFFARTTVRIGIRVAVVCAGLVLTGAVLFLIYLGWKSTPVPSSPNQGPRFRLEFDPIDLISAGILLGVCAVLLAGIATVWISNRAVEPLAESFRRQRMFIADASHELRTPLAVLSARTQQLQRATRSDEKLSALSSALRTDVKEMVDIVDDLLTTASFDSSAEPSDLIAVLSETVPPLQLLGEKKNVHLNVQLPEVSSPPLTVPVPQVALRRTLGALIDNAIAHSPVDSTVVVRVEASASKKRPGWWLKRTASKSVVVFVTDSGAGIQGIEAERVFERFARGAASSQPAGKASHGIGLALVSDVATRYGGEANVESTGLNGTTFSIRLPLLACINELQPHGSSSENRG